MAIEFNLHKLLYDRTGVAPTRQEVHERVNEAVRVNRESTLRARGTTASGENPLHLLPAQMDSMKESVVTELRLLRSTIFKALRRRPIRIPSAFVKKSREQSGRASGTGVNNPKTTGVKPPVPVATPGAQGGSVAKDALAVGGGLLAARAAGRLAARAAFANPYTATAAVMLPAVMAGSKLADDIQKESYAPRKEGETKLVDRLSSLTRLLGGKAADKRKEMEDEKARIEEISRKARERDAQRDKEAKQAVDKLSKSYADSVGGAAESALESIRKKTEETQETIKKSIEEIDELDKDGKPTGRKVRVPGIAKKALTATQVDKFIRDHGAMFGLGGESGGGAGSSFTGGSGGGGGGGDAGAGLTPGGAAAPAADAKSPFGALGPDKFTPTPPDDPNYSFGKNVKTAGADNDWSKDRQFQFPSKGGVKMPESLTTAAKQPAAKPTEQKQSKPFASKSESKSKTKGESDSEGDDDDSSDDSAKPAAAQRKQSGATPVSSADATSPLTNKTTTDTNPPDVQSPVLQKANVKESGAEIFGQPTPQPAAVPMNAATQPMAGAWKIAPSGEFTPASPQTAKSPFGDLSSPSFTENTPTAIPSMVISPDKPGFGLSQYVQSGINFTAPEIPQMQYSPPEPFESTVAEMPQNPPVAAAERGSLEGPDISEIPTTARDKVLRAQQATDHT
jgi:uncharacterized membrane protein YgcG